MKNIALTQDELRHYNKSLLGKPYADLSPCEIFHQFQFLSSCYAQRKDRKGVSVGLSKTVLKRLNFLTSEIFSGLKSRKQEQENLIVFGDVGVIITALFPETSLKAVDGEAGVSEQVFVAPLQKNLMIMG
jgi:hypothetical protein